MPLTEGKIPGLNGHNFFRPPDNSWLMKKYIFFILYLLGLGGWFLPAQVPTQSNISIDSVSLRPNLNIEIYLSVGGQLYDSPSVKQYRITESYSSKTYALKPLGIRQKEGKLILTVSSSNPSFRGRTRLIRIGLVSNPDIWSEISLQEGTPVHPIETAPHSSLITILNGVILLLLLLLGLSELIPAYRIFKFKQAYVKPYAKVRAHRKMEETPNMKIHKHVEEDPFTKATLQDDDQVVDKCQHLHLWGSWKNNGYSCSYYPNCKADLGANCQSEHRDMGIGKFFFQEGVFKKLNWLWFGCLGGWLAWCIWAALDWSCGYKLERPFWIRR